MDTDPARLAPEDYLLGINFQNKYGAGTNIAGTAKVAEMVIWDPALKAWMPTTMSAGRNKVIGRKEDRSNDRLLYYVWNEEGNHAIHAYHYQEKRIYVMFRHSLLNFQEYALIPESALFGEILCFTDGVNSPRSMNIEQIGKLFTDPLLYEDRFIELLKCPPLFPLQVSLEVGTSDELGKNVYTFIYRYHYVDHEVSRWSPESKAISAGYQGLDFGQIRYDWSRDLIDFSGGGTGNKYRKLIAYIEVAARDGYARPWRLIKKVTLSDGDTQSSDVFTNEGSYPLVASSSTDDLFDAIPLKSECLTAIDNRIFLGGNTDGFPHYNLEVTGAEDDFIQTSFPDGRQLAFKNNSKNQIGVVFFDKGNRSSLVYVKEATKIKVPVGFDRASNYRYVKKFSLAGTPPEWAVGYRLLRLDTLNRAFFLQGIVNGVSYLKNIDGDNGPVLIRKQIGTTGILKDGEWIDSYTDSSVASTTYTIFVSSEQDQDRVYPVGVPIYEGGYDAEGNKIVVVKTHPNFFGKTVHELFTEHVIGQRQDGGQMFYGGYNEPPSYTTRQPVIDYIPSTAFVESRYIGIDISNWYSASKKNETEVYPNNEMYYNFQEGDRVDILYSRVGDYIGVLSLPVIDFKADQLIIPVTKELIEQLGGTLGPGTFIEVFTPQKPGEAVIYREFGEDYKVINGAFEKTDFEISEGDAHLIKKKMYANGLETPDDFWVYSMTPDSNKTFETWEHGSGRVNIVAEIEERQSRKTNQIKASQPYVQNSLINGLSTFDEALQFTYPLDFGYLTKLRPAQNNQDEVTDILLADFSKERISIYIGKISLQDEAGGQQVVKSTSLFGSYNPLLGSFGSIHPSGAYQVDSRDYSWDHTKGAVVRYSRDGLTPISRVKMRKYFRFLQQQLRGKEYDVFTGYDANHDQLFITFRQRGGPFNQTLVWDEPANGWKYFSTIAPEYYGFIGSEFISFLGGELYVHEAGQVHNEFYGVKHPTEVILCFNDDVDQSKSNEAIRIWATEAFAAPVIRTHRVTRTGEVAQETSLNIANFKLEEGIYVSGIRHNKNTKGVVSPEVALVDGDQMRGSYLTVHLTLNPDVEHEAFFYSAMVKQTVSYPLNIK